MIYMMSNESTFAFVTKCSYTEKKMVGITII